MSELVPKVHGISVGSLVVPALDRMLLLHAIVIANLWHLSEQLSCPLVLVLPFLLSKDPL